MRWLIAVGAIVLVGCGGTSKTDPMADLAGVDGISGDKVGVAITFVGKGTVASGGSTVCDGTSSPCSFTVAANTNLTLTAAPSEGYAFSTWQCNLTPATTMAALSISSGTGLQCTVTFTKQSYSLTINVAPSGGGTVLGTPGSLQCGVGGTVCQTTQEYGTVVALSLVKAQFYTFSGWSGDCSGTSENLNVTLTKNMTCTATLTAVTFPLSMSVLGPNGDTGPFGTLQTAPDVGTCNTASCAAVNVAGGTALTITAVPATNYQVGDWGGDCIGSGSSATINSIVMNAAKSCSVRFVKQKRLLTVNVTGGGHVTSDTGGIDSPSIANSAEYDHGTTVQLTATPTASGASFNGWGGDCSASGTTSPITVTMSAAKTCTASFSTNVPVLLTFGITPAASGTVEIWIDKAASGSADQSCTTVNPTGCGTGSTILAGKQVILKATANSGYAFDHWSGTAGCSGTTNPFTLTMNADKSCTANFVKTWVVTFSGTSQPSGSGGAVTVTTGGTACASSGCAVPEGTAMVLTAAANTGYRVQSFSCTPAATMSSLGSSASPVSSATATFSPTSNIDCTAVFRERQTVIGAVSPGAGSSVTPSTSKVIDVGTGEVYSLAFATTGARRIKSLSGAFASGSGTATGCSVNNTTTAPTSVNTDVAITTGPVSGTYTCTATIADRITITASTAGASTSPVVPITPQSAVVPIPASPSAGTVTVDAGASVGTQATLTAPSIANHTFTGWTGGNGCATAGVGSTATIANATTNITCTANYILTSSIPALTATAQVAGPVGVTVNDGSGTCLQNDIAFSAAPGAGEYWCKQGPTSSGAGSASFANAAFVKCATSTGANTGVLVKAAATYSGGLGGQHRIQVQWRNGSFQTGVLYDTTFYLHTSLNCAKKCAYNKTPTDYFKFGEGSTSFRYNKYNWETAVSFTSRALSGQGTFSSPVLENPFVDITFKDLHVETRHEYGGFRRQRDFPIASQRIQRPTLRRTFTMNAAKDMILIRRNYASSRVKEILGFDKCTMSIDMGIDVNYQNNYHRHHPMACHGILLNARGEGICLQEYFDGQTSTYKLRRATYSGLHPRPPNLPYTFVHGSSLQMWEKLIDGAGHKEDWRGDELTLPQ